MMAQSALPPGFRFHPTDVELVSYYLKRKVMGKPFRIEAISEIELYKFAPWDLPDKSCLKSKDLEWYFFCPRGRKYANGSRTSRTTDIGYWKTTGKDKPIIHNSRTVGMRKTLVFHIGKAPRGDRTDWLMYEYRLEDKELGDTQYSQDSYVLCKIFQKSGSGPKNGEQYGAPFKEEDWEDDVASVNAFSFPHPSSPPESLNDLMFEPVASAGAEMSSLPDLSDTDGILLDQLVEILNSSPLHSGSTHKEMSDSLQLLKNVDEFSDVDTEGLYKDLDDLFGQADLRLADSICFSENRDEEYALQPVISEFESEQYLELNDLHFLGESNRSELMIPDDLLAYDSFAHYASLQNNMDNPTFFIDSDVSTASILRDSFPKGPDIFNYPFALIPEMVDFGRSAQLSSVFVCQPEDSRTISPLQ